MSSQLATFEEDRRQCQEQLDVVLVSLKEDPENPELKSLQAELTEMISLLDESISELKPRQAPKPTPATQSLPVEPEKWSRENHPAFKKNTTAIEDKPDSPPMASYKLNDTVLAKWVSGDRAFYPARITSITGSSTDPVYIVKFKSYDGTETLRAKDIRPVSNKRKADGTPASSSAASPAHTVPSTTPVALPPKNTTIEGPASSADIGVVTSASASIYPEQQARLDAERTASGVIAQQPKPKKIKATRELEKGKNKWQEFNSKSKFGKAQKKDSMFRTPEGVHGRVGFTGSGQAMRKDPTRSRHIYQQNDDLD